MNLKNVAKISIFPDSDNRLGNRLRSRAVPRNFK